MGPKSMEKERQRNESGESSTSSDSVSKYIPTPPDGGWGWVIVVASFVNHIIVDGVAFTFGIYYMEFMKFFKSSKSETALVGSLLAGFYLMAGPIASALVNKFGCRAVCIAGSLISSLAFILCTLSTSIQHMMITYGCLGGFGFGLIYLPSIVSVSYYFEKRRALATGIAVCGAGVGCFIFAPAGRLLMQHFDWKNSMYVVAGITLNSCICGMLMKPLDPPKKLPRSKNFFDRLREKLCWESSHQQESTTVDDEHHPNMMERVQEAKLARVKALMEDEDGDSVIGSLKHLDSTGEKSRNTSVVSATPDILPQIIIEDEDEDEKAKMIRKESKDVDDNAKTGTSTPELSQNNTKAEHALLLANSVEMNGNCKPNGLHHLSVKSGDSKTKSFSTANVWGLNPHPANIPAGVMKEDYARPLYRRDIFYSGSILHIQEFRSQPNVTQYVASITNIPNEPEPEKEGRFWKCIPIPKAAKDILKQMLDLTLLKDPVFLIACLGEIFGFIGLFVPFVFVAERAIALNIPDTQAAFLLSVIGITNTIGRVISGWLADFQWMNSLMLHNIMMILGGIACILNMYATTYSAMCVFCAFFGLCVATYISLTSIILCDLMGLERLTSAFGLLTLVRGLSSIAGPPIAGYVFDLTQNYDTSFHVGGTMFIVAGGIYCLLHLPCFGTKSRIAKNNPVTNDSLHQVNVIVNGPDFKPDDEDDVIRNGDITTGSPFCEVDLGNGSTTLSNKADTSEA